jgi:hypothetical protein
MKVLKIIFWIIIISFLLNFAWENTHAPLYLWFINYSSHLKMCFDASIWDIFLILFMYFFISLLLSNYNWIESIKIKEFLLITILWLIITIIFEKYALSTSRWAYNEFMPIIPFIWIWLSPVLQLIVTPYITFLLVWKYLNYKNR